MVIPWRPQSATGTRAPAIAAEPKFPAVYRDADLEPSGFYVSAKLVPSPSHTDTPRWHGLSSRGDEKRGRGRSCPSTVFGPDHFSSRHARHRGGRAPEIVRAWV